MGPVLAELAAAYGDEPGHSVGAVGRRLCQPGRRRVALAAESREKAALFWFCGTRECRGDARERPESPEARGRPARLCAPKIVCVYVFCNHFFYCCTRA
mmetsp:Transcript_23716/g.77225  ORF Transcript_23716/g.77225 Transcript_23716/m.77225 type:complete len:99 (+) Transcript_23716:1103-1399(+)